MTNEERREKEEFGRDMERFKIVLKTRDFEIELFWKRSSYFLALNTALATALAAGLFALPSVENEEPFWFLFVGICFAGFFICLAWVQVVLGSKYWYSHWEQIVMEEQEFIGFCRSKDRGYFGIEGTDKRVEKNLDEKKMPPWMASIFFRPFLLFISYFPGTKKIHNKMVLTKPSVSDWMYKTAVFFLFAWVAGGVWASSKLDCWARLEAWMREVIQALCKLCS